MRFFLRRVLLRERMMRPSRCCALDIRRGCISRERWQIVFAHLRSGLVTGGEFDQGRFAKRCPPGPKTSLAPYCATIFWRSVSAHFFPCLRFSDLINGIFGRAGPTLMKTILLTLISIGLTLQLQAQNNGNANVPTQHNEATIAELQAQMRAGSLTSVQLTKFYLDRIAALDQNGTDGGVNSIIELNSDAFAIAQHADELRKQGNVLGPLHGIPVLIKDNIDTHDKMQTTAGSFALFGKPALQDSTVAANLRAGGAVILGKTNLSEWANFRSFESTSGWSGRGGQCRNPYALDRNPCGSSSGTGTAVAANLAAVGVGTETDGSVVGPPSAAALVGIKPTLGLVSRRGIVPIAHSQDTAGPMTRTVRDAAILLGVLAGADPEDAVTATGPGISDYTQFLDAAGLKGATIGVARTKLMGYHPATDLLVSQALDVMRQQGATIVDPADIPHVGEYDDAELTVLLYEFKADVNAYLAEFAPGAPVKTLQDVIDFNAHNADREMPFFGQDLLLKAQAKGDLTVQEYVDALAKCRRLARDEGLKAVLDQHKLDAIVAPTGNPAWPIDLVNGDHFLGGSSTPAAVAGFPHVTVPAGYVSGLPVGLSFIGAPWSAATLIRLAYAYEQATTLRRTPRFLPTMSMSS